MGTPLRIITDDLSYPESDGEPLGETGLHVNLILELKAALDVWFCQRQDVLVGSNQLLYYVRGNLRQFLVPDVYVMFETSPEPRRTLKIWEEGKAPEVVFEISSKATYEKDLAEKVSLYELIGVREYFVFDPEYRLQPESLIGFRMKGRRYEMLTARQGVMQSQQLKLELVDTGKTLRLRHPQTGEWLMTPQEEAAARLHAEAELARVQKELAQLREKKSSRGKKR